MGDKYPSTLLVSLADKLAKISDEVVRQDIETEIRKADLDLLAKINETYAAIANVPTTFTVPGWGTFQFGKWYSYTPTFTGFGTVSTSDCWWKLEGGSLKWQLEWTCGTPTATEGRVSFPLSLVSQGITNIKLLGAAAVNANASQALTVLVRNAVSYMAFGAYNVAGLNPQQALNGSVLAGAGAIITAWGECQVSGWN